MEFREKQAIYLQIAEYVCGQVLLNRWKPGDKIISIRELAVALEVNPNTVQRAYDFLQQKEIIQNKRGLGFFADENAHEKILAFRREQFTENELPVLFRNMYLLQMDMEEVKTRYNEFVKQNFKQP